MPSFDVVSEIDLQEVRNVVDHAARELRGRFDFRGVDAGVSLEGDQVQLWAPEEFQVAQLLDILHDKMAKRRLDVSALAPGEVEGAGKVKRQTIGLKQGVDRDSARRIVKLVKDSKIKAQSQIPGRSGSRHRQETRRPAAPHRRHQGRGFRPAAAIQQLSRLATPPSVALLA